MTPRKSAELFERLGSMTPSKSSLGRLPKVLAERCENSRRAVVVAHGSHVACRTSALRGGPFVSLGERLRPQLGDRYRAIAVTGFDVTISRVQGQSHYQHDEANAVERSVHELGLPLAFVDFMCARSRDS